MNQELIILKNNQRRYREYIRETMLPEIANEILREDHLIVDGSEMILIEGCKHIVYANLIVVQ